MGAKVKGPTIGKGVTHIDEWEVTSAVDTLVRAEEIKQNPKLMKLVREKIKKKKIALDLVVEEELD